MGLDYLRGFRAEETNFRLMDVTNPDNQENPTVILGRMEQHLARIEQVLTGTN